MLLISTPLFFINFFLFNQFVAILQGQPLGPRNLRLERFIPLLLGMLASSVYALTRAIVVVGLSQEVYSLAMADNSYPLVKTSSPVGCSSSSLDDYLSKGQIVGLRMDSSLTDKPSVRVQDCRLVLYFFVWASMQ